ncbi:MAG TPA: carboxypeptidase regulatory-like domain-containing protein [Candidatus Acidoferrum sp.]|nr:carboxypeptidase regulatory-like domain-containing protein [Candidatus Acidoferrum sp.]
MRRTILFSFAVAAVLALGISGCGKSSNESGSSAVQAPEPTKVVDQTTAATITGTVKLDGEPPKFKPLNMAAEPTCVQDNPAPVVPPIVVTGPKGALANVVVYVKGNMDDYKFDTPKEPAVLDQKNCMYDPHVLALMTSQDFHVTNSDQTLHNIHPVPRQNHVWNQSQPAGAPPIDRSFPNPELAIPVNCNVHPWMRGYLFVFRHPFFAVTRRDGKFTLNGLPPGDYTIEAWQERYGMQDQTITLAPNDSKAISFTFHAAPQSGN